MIFFNLYCLFQSQIRYIFFKNINFIVVYAHHFALGECHNVQVDYYLPHHLVDYHIDYTYYRNCPIDNVYGHQCRTLHDHRDGCDGKMTRIFSFLYHHEITIYFYFDGVCGAHVDGAIHDAYGDVDARHDANMANPFYHYVVYATRSSTCNFTFMYFSV